MIQIYFLLSSECNLNCSFCIRHTAKKEVMPLQNAIKALEKISSEYSNVQLIISGGEPFLYPNFDEIIEYACTRFRSVYINTNGTQCNSKISFLTRFADKITVQVSIDGDVYSHNSMRGDGVYEEAMRNISLMKENNIRIVVSSSVNKENNKSLKNIIPELELNRVDLWKISPIQAFTKAEYEKNLSVTEWNDFVDDILKYSKLRVFISKLFDFSIYEKIEKKYGKEYLSQKVVSNCGSAKNKFYVYPDFEVYPCTCLTDYAAGNVIKDSISQIKENLRNIEQLFFPKNSICKECKWLYLCNGGCQGYSYHFYHDLGMGDIRCPLLRKVRHNEI